MRVQKINDVFGDRLNRVHHRHQRICQEEMSHRIISTIAVTFLRITCKGEGFPSLIELKYAKYHTEIVTFGFGLFFMYLCASACAYQVFVSHANDIHTRWREII